MFIDVEKDTFFALKIVLRYIDMERKSAVIGGMHSMAKSVLTFHALDNPLI